MCVTSGSSYNVRPLVTLPSFSVSKRVTQTNTHIHTRNDSKNSSSDVSLSTDTSGSGHGDKVGVSSDCTQQFIKKKEKKRWAE